MRNNILFFEYFQNFSRKNQLNPFFISVVQFCQLNDNLKLNFFLFSYAEFYKSVQLISSLKMPTYIVLFLCLATLNGVFLGLNLYNIILILILRYLMNIEKRLIVSVYWSVQFWIFFYYKLQKFQLFFIFRSGGRITVSILTIVAEQWIKLPLYEVNL